MTRAALGDLRLESGEVIHDFEQSYVTHGTLNGDKSNAILVCASLTGNHTRLDFLIGPGLALDPARWFVVATDAIGNGLSTSPSNSKRQPGMKFPRFVLRDMVHAQHRLLTEHLGLTRVHAVAGASMGGMQALQWGVSHPGFMRALVAMTPMAKTHAWSALVVATARACLTADPAWTGEGFSRRPDRGWVAYAGLMNALVMRTPGVALERDLQEFVAAVEKNGFDAHDYLYQSWAYESHDVGTTPGFDGVTGRALASIRAKALLLAPPLDLLNPAECAREAAQSIPGAELQEIPSTRGHQAATKESQTGVRFLNEAIGRFLAAC
jgi:homoserine O-acetyltransferase